MFLQNSTNSQNVNYDLIRKDWQKDQEIRNQIEFEIMLKRIKELDKQYQKFNNLRYNFKIFIPSVKNNNLY